MNPGQPASGRPDDAPRRGPLVVGLIGPPEAASQLAVALTTGLRLRGYRVGAAESRTTIEGRIVTVLTFGSGARVTLEGDLAVEALEARAAALDPTLDVLLAPGAHAAAVIELLPGESPPVTEESRLLAAVPAARLVRAFAEAGPAADLGLTEVIAARLAPTTPHAERALERTIETSRRRLPAPPPPPPEGAPRRSLLARLRRTPNDRGTR